MIGIAMIASNRSRYLAPLALAAAVAATVVVVTSTTRTSHHAAARPPAATATATNKPHKPRSHASGAQSSPRTYVVKSGDTLSAIASKTGVPLSTIESLNPGVNPSALQTGQRLKLGQ
jgi:LysM repeat protein